MVTKSKLGKKALRNIEEVTMMLKMFKGQKLVESRFNDDYTGLSLHFSDFVLYIDLQGAKWTKKSDLRILPSPITGRTPREEDFNRSIKKYKKGIEKI